MKKGKERKEKEKEKGKIEDRTRVIGSKSSHMWITPQFKSVLTNTSLIQRNYTVVVTRLYFYNT